MPAAKRCTENSAKRRHVRRASLLKCSHDSARAAPPQDAFRLTHNESTRNRVYPPNPHRTSLLESPDVNASRSRFRAATLGCALAFVALAGAARADSPTGQTIDGISCDRAEGAVFHIHQHLRFSRGVNRSAFRATWEGRSQVTACIGCTRTRRTASFTSRRQNFARFCSASSSTCGVSRSGPTAAGPARAKKGAIRTYVDGHPYAGDPRKIELAQHTDITIEAGPPYTKPVPFTDWQGQ